MSKNALFASIKSRKMDAKSTVCISFTRIALCDGPDIILYALFAGLK